VISWGDETGISNQDQLGRSDAPQGKTPVVARTVRRISQSMIAAVSNRGLVRFMLYPVALTAARFIAFLRRLVRDAGQKVILIVDNLKVHHTQLVKKRVMAHRHEIEQQLRQRPQPGSKEELVKGTRAVLRPIQRSPNRIRSYFTPEPVRYAA
jgi:hypothetical protein